MVQVKEGKLIGSGAKFGIVVARFNEFICSKLLGGAYDALHRHGVDDADITTAWVPGAFEIPLIAQKMAESGKYDAVICLGAVIRGATSTMTWSAANRLKASPRHPLRRASPSCSASSRRKTSNRLSNGLAQKPATKASTSPPALSKWSTSSKNYKSERNHKKGCLSGRVLGKAALALWDSGRLYFDRGIWYNVT